MNTLTKEVQFDKFVDLKDLKPEIGNSAIFFAVSAEHEDLSKYCGDARSFGYNFDDGHCTVVTYNQVVGILAEDTVALFDDAQEIKKYLKKPNHHILEVDEENNADCDSDSAELLIRYSSEYFYKDECGYWFKTEYYCDGEATRVTDESAEIYREVNKEYQRSVTQYNRLMKEVLENMETLKDFA